MRVLQKKKKLKINRRLNVFRIFVKNKVLTLPIKNIYPIIIFLRHLQSILKRSRPNFTADFGKKIFIFPRREVRSEEPLPWIRPWYRVSSRFLSNFTRPFTFFSSFTSDSVSKKFQEYFIQHLSFTTIVPQFGRML